MDEKKQKLIEALKTKRDLFISRGQNSKEHNITIRYLEDGKTNHNPDEWPLLYAAIYDFDTLCSDYAD